MTKRILTAMCAAMMVMSVATSCGGENSSSTASDESSSSTSASGTDGTGTCQDSGCVWDAYTPYEETVTFTKGISATPGSENFPEGDDYVNNDVTRYVKEKVNVQPEIEWQVDPNNYDQKVALSITTGDIPDIMMVNRDIFDQLVENDLIQDMTEAYEKCISPFVREQYDSYDKRLFENVMVDGKMMGLPGCLISDEHNILWVRQDWLDALNMEAPTTVEEIEEVARAFVENDMSGTGNTIGLSAASNVYGGISTHHGLLPIFNYYGAYPGNWIEVDGKMTYGSIQPEMKEALTLIQGWYQEGLLDKEFAVRKGTDQQALVSSGQLGMVYAPWWDGAGILEAMKNNPEAEWVPVSAPLDENGKYHLPTNDGLQNILVVSKDFEHPEAIIKAFNAENDIARGHGDGRDAYFEMIETSPGMGNANPVGLHVNYRDCLKRNMLDVMAAVEAEDPSVLKLPALENQYNIFMKERENPKADLDNWFQTFIYTDVLPVATGDQNERKDIPFYGTTPTMSSKWANLEKLENEMLVKIVTGEESVDYFDEFVATWKQMGGEDIIAEVQAEVDSRS